MSYRLSGLTGSLVGALALLLLLWVTTTLAYQSPQSTGVIISEIGWSGTAAGATFEWLELYNNSDSPVDLTGWLLEDDDLLATLSGTLGANEFHILERSDHALLDITADNFLSGALANEGEEIRLLAPGGYVIDTANHTDGPWPAGTDDEYYRSMERAHPLAGDEAEDWQSNDGVTRNGLDANGQPINGTPGKPNSGWTSVPLPNLVLAKKGPAHAVAGSIIQYDLTISNTGKATARGVVMTDTLPPAASYSADDGHFPLTQPISDTLVWQVGEIDPVAAVTIRLSVTLEAGWTGALTNMANASTVVTETQLGDNKSTFASWVTTQEPSVLVDAVYYDGYALNDRDEAVRLINVGGSPQELGGWQISDGLSYAIFQSGATLDPGQRIWITNQAISFRRHFGESPDYELGETDPTIASLEGTWPGFSNAGDEVLLLNEGGEVQDALVYGAGNSYQPGWSGSAVLPYVVTGVFAEEGQILYRRPGDVVGTRAPDTDTAADWAQFPHDPVNGRRVLYPGWDLEQFSVTHWITETAEFIIGIAPDNAFELLQSEIAGAQSELLITSHSFRSAAIAQELIAAIDRGVEITVLLEGGPVGGIDSAEMQNCQQLENAGGQCWFMINDPVNDIFDRYRYLHAKFMIIDGRRVLISTENLSPDSMPEDDKSDGTWGRRGVVIVTDAQAAVSRLRAIWDADFDSANHVDLVRWPAVTSFASGPSARGPQIEYTNRISYSVTYTRPTILQGEFAYAIIQSPENSLDDAVGILPLMGKAGLGDTILVEQLSEKPHWGPSSSNSLADPNPRLEAMIDAARRGATVRLLLDRFFDDDRDPASNWATCQYVNQTAVIEDLNLRCELANPTGLGLHNKMFLAEINGQGHVVAGSINGTELSNKGNREVALMLRSNAAYALLAGMFTRDWPHIIRLPLVFDDFVGPAQHIVISEVLYDPPGLDDAEFIELYNPMPWQIDLSGHSLGDALKRSDFEDVRRFPAGTYLEGHTALVIATTATGFFSLFGDLPDFEILDSDPTVPDLLDDGNWGDPAALLQLANGGDEVIVRDPAGQIIEAIAYGSGLVPGNVSCPGATLAGASLERYPPWRDTDDCPQDFREWPFPNPGVVP